MILLYQGEKTFIMRIDISIVLGVTLILKQTSWIGRIVKITVGFTDKYVLYRKHTKEKSEHFYARLT